jgi:hypothetical protein
LKSLAAGNANKNRWGDPSTLFDSQVCGAPEFLKAFNEGFLTQTSYDNVRWFTSTSLLAADEHFQDRDVKEIETLLEAWPAGRSSHHLGLKICIATPILKAAQKPHQLEKLIDGQILDEGDFLLATFSSLKASSSRNWHTLMRQNKCMLE